MGFNWGSVNYKGGKYVDADLSQYKDVEKGSLEEISDTLKEAVEENGAKMEEIISKLKEDPSDSAALAEYQAVFAQWSQANMLRATSVQKAAENNSEIMRKM